MPVVPRSTLRAASAARRITFGYAAHTQNGIRKGRRATRPVSELDDTRADNSPYIEIDRSFFEARTRTLPEVGLGVSAHPRRPLYWLFDTFSYKSYLLCHVIRTSSGRVATN
jgi:hypothetical protein